MKLTTAVLVTSLALNALGLTAWLRSRESDSAAEGSGSGSPASSATAGVARPSTAPANVSDHPPAALRVELQKLKLPTEVIDALVTARIYARHDARRRELILATHRLPWWQAVTGGLDRMNLLTAAERKELRTLNAAARAEVLGLLGPGALDRDGAIAARYPFVSPERAVALDGLVRDYEDIGAALREEMHGLRTAADRKREAFIATERQADLAKLLTPEEREIFELRTSPGASQIGQRRGAFDPSEQEYRALIAVYREFEQATPGTVTPEGRARPASMNEYPEYEQKIRAALGEERYADWLLGGQRHTHILSRLAPDYGFTSAMVKESAQLLADTATRSWAIGEDRSITPAEKRAALSALAAATRSTLARKLGESGSAALLGQTAWLDMIANGQAVKTDGYGASWRPVDSASQPPRPSTPPASPVAPTPRN